MTRHHIDALKVLGTPHIRRLRQVLETGDVDGLTEEDMRICFKLLLKFMDQRHLRGIRSRLEVFDGEILPGDSANIE